MPPEFPHLHLKIERRKTFPLLDRVERVEWTGNDFESGITNRLNTDASLVDALSAVANTGRKYDLNPNTWTWVPGVFKVLTGSGKKRCCA
jgi:hypothetical protein